MSEPVKIPKFSDSTILDCFSEVHAKHQKNIAQTKNQNNKGSIVIFGGLSISDIDFSQEYPEQVNHIKELNSALIERISVHFKNLNIVFTRGGSTKSDPLSGIYDEILFTINQNANDKLNDKIKIDIIHHIISKLKYFNPDRVTQETYPIEFSRLESIHNSTLEQLEKTGLDLIKENHRHKNDLELKYDKKVLDLEEKISSKQKQLEEDFEKKHIELKQREDELTKKIKEIDDRDNTHARREIRKDLLNEIQKRSQEFKLTEGTSNLRNPIHLAFITAFATLAILTTMYTLDFSKYISTEGYNINIATILGLKQITFTAGLIGTIIFYIKWLNKWFEQHSTSEFYIKQFQLDIDRASWIVETALEWSSNDAKQIPEPLVSSLTKGLFENSAQNNNIINHPAEDLASSILGAASNIKLKSGDSELNFQGKNINKAIKK